MTPAMTRDEIALLSKYTSKCANYFEFGVGGSTVHVFNNSESKIRGVDSSIEWLSNVQSVVGSERVLLTHVDIGPVGAWGRPVDDKFKHKWCDYSMSIHETDITPDFILVDGRFRVGCILQSIIFSLNKNCDPIISLHDCQREGYKLGTKHLRCIERSSNLAMFKIPEEKIDINLLEIEYNKHKHLID